MNPEPFLQLDRVIHEKGRLAIMSALAASPELSFTELRDLLIHFLPRTDRPTNSQAMKNSLNEPERSQSQALCYKVNAVFQFNAQRETRQALTPALSRPTGEGESPAAPIANQSAGLTERSPEWCEPSNRCSPLPTDGRGVKGEGRGVRRVPLHHFVGSSFSKLR